MHLAVIRNNNSNRKSQMFSASKTKQRCFTWKHQSWVRANWPSLMQKLYSDICILSKRKSENRRLSLQKDDQQHVLVPKSGYSLTYFQNLINTYMHNLPTSPALGFQHRLECSSHLGLNIRHPAQVCLLGHCLETLIPPSDVPFQPGCGSPQLADVIMLCC